MDSCGGRYGVRAHLLYPNINSCTANIPIQISRESHVCCCITRTLRLSGALASPLSHLLNQCARFFFVTGLITARVCDWDHSRWHTSCRSEGRGKRASSSIIYCRDDLILSHNISASTQWDSATGNKSSSLHYLFLCVPGDAQQSRRDEEELEWAWVMSPVPFCEKPTAGPSYTASLYL